MKRSICQVQHQHHIQTEFKEAPLRAGRQQVALLGGNFNPVHQAHLVMADQVYHQLNLDRVLFLPSAVPPHVDKKKTIASNHRIAMLELAIAGNSGFGIETADIDRGGKSYTYDTLKYLKQRNPDVDYFFIVGGDMVDYLPTWYRIDDLMKMVNFVGVQRSGYPKRSQYPIIWVDVPPMDISSSFIRTNLKIGCSVHYFLPENVIDYIKEKGLYLDEI